MKPKEEPRLDFSHLLEKHLGGWRSNGDAATDSKALRRSLPGDLMGPSGMLALGREDVALLIDATNALALSGEELNPRLERMQARLRCFRDHLAPVVEVVCFALAHSAVDKDAYTGGWKWELQRLELAPATDQVPPWKVQHAGREQRDTGQRVYFMRAGAKTKVVLYVPEGPGEPSTWWAFQQDIEKAMAELGYVPLQAP